MKKRDVINISLLLMMTIFLVIYKSIIITKYLRLEEVITSSVLMILAFLSIILLGYRKDKTNPKKIQIKNTIIYLIVLYFFIYFGLGFLFGFLTNSYSLKINKIITNIICPLLIIISTEIIRNIVVKANKDKMIIIVIITLLLIIQEVLMSINMYDLTSFEGIFKLITISIMPATAYHTLLTYLTYYTGIKNCLIYRIPMQLYIYVLPLAPNVGNYLNCVIGIIFPYIVYCMISKLQNEREYIKNNYKVRKFGVSDLVFTIIFLILVSLVGGIFNHKLISVASNSMQPALNKGDAVIIDKKIPEEEIKEDDIISFSYNGRNTIHRITRIEEKDGIKIYHTKGDNNNAEDSNVITYEYINGKVVIKIPYIGYPSVMLEEFRRGKSET